MKNCVYEGAIVPMALYRAEAWGMRSAEGGKCMFLRSIVLEVSWEFHEWIVIGIKRSVGKLK